ncbi:MAG TPA: NAD(P)-dependent oxidoreductase [Vicinamibacterales bacterium]|nr:NAD(P)-dependent oxidoreductase [Vicinamibacterales bacterium]
MRVLVTGASGQLADAVRRAFADRDVIAHARAALDVTDIDAVMRAVAEARPDAIVNCAAFNQVDAAESRPSEAFAVNAFAVRTLARAAEACGATLVHYGSDFVFAGLDSPGAEPYDESAAPSPQSVYAASKLVGEWMALEYPRGYVLRVESLFGLPAEWTGRRGSLETIVAGLEAGREVPVFTDRVVSPSYVVDVAAATRHLIDSHAAPGLYHCVNSGHATWHQVACEAARLLRVQPRLKPITTDEARFIAARPRFCALSNRKLAAAGFEMPAWQDALQRWLAARGGSLRAESTDFASRGPASRTAI